MMISDELRNTNRAEYILHLWQVEDLLRAYGLDEERVTRELTGTDGSPDEEQRKAARWYADLCDMMRREGVAEKGHIQIARGALAELADLHARLLASERFPGYRAAYMRVLPYIVELRSRAGGAEKPEIETCFEALYGVMLLRMQKKELSPATARATADIAALLHRLSDYYFKERDGLLDFD